MIFGMIYKIDLLIKLINNYKNYNIISFLFNIEIF